MPYIASLDVWVSYPLLYVAHQTEGMEVHQQHVGHD